MDEHLLLSDSDGTLACCACQGLLDDPRQLQCLHNCCCRCTNTIAAKEGGRSVTCPECGQVTDVEAASRNYFMTARLSRFKALIEAKTCGVCKEEGNVSQPALVWCASCRRSLCAECIPGHARYNRTHATVLLDEVHSWDDVCPAPAITCPQHGKPFDFVCFTCEAMLCVDCWVPCNKSRHDVQHVGDASVSSYVSKIRDDVRHRQSDLQSKLPQLSATLGLPDEVERALEDALAGLKQRKQQVMVAVDDAYTAAEESIRNSFDSLHANATELSSAAASLDRKISFTMSYGDAVVKSSEASNMIHQQKHLLGHMSALSAEIDAMTRRVEAAEVVTVSSSLPENLAEVVAAWIGLPRLTAGDQVASKTAAVEKKAALCDTPENTKQTKLDNVVSKTSKRKKKAERLNESSSTATQDAAQVSTAATVDVASFEAQSAADATSAQAHDGQLQFSFLSCSKDLVVPGQCWDVAVTLEGHLLLAALEQGLKELELVSGRELAVWKPANEQPQRGGKKCVIRVDCLPDGRAVVAVSYKDRKRAAESIVSLLRRTGGYRDGNNSGSSIWSEERVFVGLSSPPQQLSTSDDFLAIAESEPGGLSWLPGRHVTLVSLSSHELLWRRNCDYRVQSVAVTGSLVVTASSGTLTLRGGRLRYVVDGHSSTGDRLWRQALSEPVNDLCIVAPRASSSELLTLCLAQRDGLWTIDISNDVGSAASPDATRVRVAGCAESSEPSKLARLSVGRARPAIVATLSDDWQHVTIYTVAPISQE